MPGITFGQNQTSQTSLDLNLDQLPYSLSIGIPEVGGFKCEFIDPSFQVFLEQVLSGVDEEMAPPRGDGSSAAMAVVPPFGPPPIPPNPNTSPGPDWEWRGSPDGKLGAWYNPKTKETLHPHLDHGPGKDPHWEWIDPYGNSWDYFPGSNEWKIKDPAKHNPNKPQPTFPPGTFPMPETPPITYEGPYFPPVRPYVPTPPPYTPTTTPFPWWQLLNLPLRVVPLFYYDPLDGTDPTLG